MPRFQVPMFLCVDAEDASDAAQVARALNGHLPTNTVRNAFLYSDTLLPVIELDEEDDDPDSLDGPVEHSLGAR